MGRKRFRTRARTFDECSSRESQIELYMPFRLVGRRLHPRRRRTQTAKRLRARRQHAEVTQEKQSPMQHPNGSVPRAANGGRTRDLWLGKPALCQLSYRRKHVDLTGATRHFGGRAIIKVLHQGAAVGRWPLLTLAWGVVRDPEVQRALTSPSGCLGPCSPMTATCTPQHRPQPQRDRTTMGPTTTEPQPSPDGTTARERGGTIRPPRRRSSAGRALAL